MAALAISLEGGEASTAVAELTLDHIEPKEPYSYSALQRFSLQPDRLTVTMRITNRGEHAMPFGFGLHRGGGANLTSRFSFDPLISGSRTRVYRDRSNYAPSRVDFAKARGLPPTWRNNCYSGGMGAQS